MTTRCACANNSAHPRRTANSSRRVYLLGGGGRRCSAVRFLLLHSGGAFAHAFPKISKLRAPNRSAALDFNLLHARGVDRENAFHPFAVTDPADGEVFVQPAATPADH